jgi:hypothetical protein
VTNSAWFFENHGQLLVPMVETVVGWPLATTFCPTRHLAWQHYLTGSDIMKRVLSNTENDPTKGLVKSALQDWSVEGLIVLTRTSL